MNGRQAAKAAAARIAELEYAIGRYSADVKDYNRCILHMIKHGSPCDFCQDQQECQEAGKDLSIGCDDWMLSDGKMYAEIVSDSGKGADLVEIEGIFPAGEDRGAGTQDFTGEGPAL